MPFTPLEDWERGRYPLRHWKIGREGDTLCAPRRLTEREISCDCSLNPFHGKFLSAKRCWSIANTDSVDLLHYNSSFKLKEKKKVTNITMVLTRTGEKDKGGLFIP